MSRPQQEVNVDEILGILEFLQKPGTADLLGILLDDTEKMVLTHLIPEEFKDSLKTAAEQIPSLISLKKPQFTSRYYALLKAILNNTPDKDTEVNLMFSLLSDGKNFKQLNALSKIRDAIGENIETLHTTIETMKALTPDEKADLMNYAETASEGSGYESDSSGKSGPGQQYFQAPVLPKLNTAQVHPNPTFEVKHQSEINCTADFIDAVKRIFPEFNFDSQSGKVVTRVPEYSEANREKFEDLFEVVDKFANKLTAYAKIQSSSGMELKEIKRSVLQYDIPKLLGQTELTIAGSATKASQAIANAVKDNTPLSAIMGRVSMVNSQGQGIC